MRYVHLTLRQAVRLYELAKAAGDIDLCSVADKIIKPRTCTICGTVGETVVRYKNRTNMCKACSCKDNFEGDTE